MNEEDQLILLEYFAQDPFKEPSITDIKKHVGGKLIMNLGLIEHYFENDMKAWVERRSDNPSCYAITQQGLNKLATLRSKNHQKNLEEDFRKLNMEAAKQSIETSKSAKEAHEATVENLPIQRKLVVASIIVAGASALFTLGNFWINWKKPPPPELHMIQQTLQRQSQILDSLRQEIGYSDTLHVRLIEKDSSK